MEVIMLQYSPNEMVTWERTKKGVLMQSNHVINTIKTKTSQKYSFGTGKGVVYLAKSYAYVFCAYFTKDQKKKEAHITEATALMEKAHEHGTWRKKGIETEIKYKLRGVTELVIESELKPIKKNDDTK